MLKARLPELGLDQVDDRRRRQGRRWRLGTLLQTVVVGLVTGRNSLAELESLTDEMSVPIRRLLGIARRVADTTMRNVLVRVLPHALRQVIHRLIKAAIRRKALPLVGLPFHAAALDGKVTATPTWDHHYSQRKTYDDGRQAHGVVRVVNAVLVSTPAKPVLDTVPIPAETNEMGIFPTAFESLVRTYGNLIQLVTYDAGATGVENAKLVVDAGKDFLFRIRDERWLIFQKAVRIIGRAGAGIIASTEDALSNTKTVVRTLYLATAPKGYGEWECVRTLVRVHSQTLENGKVTAEEDRYYVSSLDSLRLTGEQWLTLVRNHWGVENNCHWTLDAIFKEDKKPWIEADPRGVVVMMLLRRIAYNLLALFRTVTQRSEEKRLTPWRDVLRHFYNALIAITEEQVEGLRSRKVAPVFS